ncbi:MAG: hypothetical protein ABSH56_15100 [Bryobacteraceae bacterium]
MARSGEQNPPAVKAWLDNVIVPALVKEWLAERSGGHGVTSEAKSDDAESEAADAIPGIEIHSKI